MEIAFLVGAIALAWVLVVAALEYSIGGALKARTWALIAGLVAAIVAILARGA